MKAAVKRGLVELGSAIGIVALMIVALASAVLLLPVLPFLYVWSRIRDARRRREFAATCGDRKVVVFVYSNSPHRQVRIEREILPLIQDQAVILNWSERSSQAWTSNPVEVRVFKRWAGDREFNPAAILLEPGERVRVIRFWQAYRDFKHSKSALLRERESELFRHLKIPPSQWPGISLTFMGSQSHQGNCA